MSICDFLFSADMIVPDRQVTLDALKTQIGLIDGPPPWTYLTESGWDLTFAPVNAERPRAPTNVEVMGVRADVTVDRGADPDRRTNGARTRDSQAGQSWLTHATVVVTSDLEGVVERARRAGRTHWFQTPAERPGFPRLWMGLSRYDDPNYDPAADCGMRLEFIPWGESVYQANPIDTSPDVARPGEAGIRRIAYRDFIVPSIDAALRNLEETFEWTPAHEVREETSRGYRFVTMAANYAQGAHLRLIEGTDPDSRAGKDARREVNGPYTIICSVYDLDATAADLEARGTPFVRLAPGKYEPETILVLSPDLGAPFAFIEKQV